MQRDADSDVGLTGSNVIVQWMLPGMLGNSQEIHVIVQPGAASDVIDLTRKNVIVQQNSASDIVDLTGSNVTVQSMLPVISYVRQLTRN